MKKLDQDQIKQLKESFDSYDKDKNGCLEISDVQACMSDLGYDLTEDEIIDIINDVDYDGSGTIEFEEFMIIMQKQGANEAEQQIRNIFEEFDTDRNGYLSVFELQQGLQKLSNQNFDISEIEELLNSANINSDGEINYEDFLTLWRKAL